MRALPGLTFIATLLLAATVHAQAPAGSPDGNEGSASSPSSVPGSQRELETHRDKDGKVRTKDGRAVNNRDGDATEDGARDDSPEHSSPGGPQDHSTDPGAIER